MSGEEPRGRAVVVPGVDLEGLTGEQRDRAMATWLFADARCAATTPEGVRSQQLDAAAMDLALWSRSWADGCLQPSELCELVLGELASLYLDQGKSESEFVAAVQFAFRSVKAARVALEAADHPRKG